MLKDLPIDRDQLKEALRQVEDEILAGLPSDEELKKVTFSKKFEDQMDELIESQKKKSKAPRLINTVGKRVAAAVIIVVAALTVTVFSVDAIATPVKNFFIQMYEKFSVVVFNKPETSSEIDFVIKHPTPPDGFTIKKEWDMNVDYSCDYEGPDGEELTYWQGISGSGQFVLDTEGVQTENQLVNGITGIYFTNKGYAQLLWSDGIYDYLLVGNLSREEILRVAESIE